MSAAVAKAPHNEEALQRFRFARAHVVQGSPFFGSFLLRQEPVEAPHVETMATDGKRVYYNPEYVLAAPIEQLHFDCAHEALHAALLHHLRRGGRDFGRWNEAADYATNPILKQAGFHLPDDALLDPQFEGLNAEEIFAPVTM